MDLQNGKRLIQVILVNPMTRHALVMHIRLIEVTVIVNDEALARPDKSSQR